MTSTTAKTITSSGGTLTGGITFSAAGPFTLQDAFTTTGTVTHTAGTIAFNGFTLTAAAYSNTGTTARALNFTTAGSKFSINSTVTATVWSIASATGLTITSPTTGSVDIVGSSNVTRTIATLALAEASTMNFNILATAGTITVTASNTFRNLVVNCPGATFSNIAITVYGNLSYLGGTWEAGANLLTLAPSSGSFTITGTGGVFDFPITYNSSPTGAGAYTLASNVTVGATAARTFTHQQGTLNLSSYVLTVYGTFNGSSNATRTLNFGTGYIDLTLDGSTATTVWDTTTVTAFTVTNAGTGSVRVKGSGSLTRSINTGGLSETNSISFEFLSTAGTITLTNLTSRIRNFIINCPGTTVSNATIACYGNFTYTAGTLSAGASTLSFLTTVAGTYTISCAGGTLDFPITFNLGSTSIIYSLSTNVSVGTSTSRQVTLTNGTLELNSYSFTIFGIFSSNAASGSRRIQMSGTGGKIVVNYNATATVWDNSGVTNMSTDGNVLVQITGGAAGTTQTINCQVSGVNSISFQISITAGTLAFASGHSAKNVTFDNNTYTVAYGTTSPTLTGNFTISGTSPTFNTASSPWTFAAASGTQTITTNTKALPFPLTFSGTATYSLGDNVNISSAGTITLTTGTIELNSYTLTIPGIFSSTGSGVRKIQMSGTGGKIVLSSASAATIWDTGVVTNMTTDGNVLVQLTGGGATVKTINSGALSEVNSISFQLSTTAGTVTFTASNTVEDLTIDNNSFTVSNIALTIYGSLIISGSSPTLTAGTNTWTFAATNSRTITSSGKTLDFPVTFSGVGGTWALQGALTMGSTRTLTLAAGTFNLNGYTCTAAGGFAATTASAKVLAHGTGDLVVSQSGLTAFNASSGTRAITDVSATAASITNNGTVVYNNATPFAGGVGGSISFNGSNQFLTLSSAAVPATGTFTIEAWVYTTASAIQIIYSQYLNTNANRMHFTIDNYTGYKLTFAHGTAATVVGTTVVPLNQWNHVAVTRDSSDTLRLFLNGNLEATQTSYTSTLGQDNPRVSGFNGVGTYNFTGNISNLRITTTAVYTAAFTPAIYPLSNITNTQFLLKATNDLTFITDSSSSPKTVTNNGTAVYSTSSPFVGDTSGSLSFNGSSQYLSITSSAGDTLDLTNKSTYTVEAWVYVNAFSAIENGIFSNRSSVGTDGYDFRVNPTGTLQFYHTGGSSITTASTLSLKTWYHVAVTRSGANVYLFINGVLSATSTSFTNGTTTAQAVWIGASASSGATGNYFNGYITNLRVVSGTALYTSTFTAPTSELTAVSGTSLLVKQNDTGKGTLTSTGSGKISMISASSKAFLGNGNSYAIINQGGAGELTIADPNIFQNITNSTQPASVRFVSGTTSTFTNGFSLAGTSGNLITLGSTAAAVSTLSKASGTVSVSYCTISYSAATGGATWNAPTSSGNVDGGNNTGWSFLSAVKTYLGMLAFF
jgi:hypothetical protein